MFEQIIVLALTVESVVEYGKTFFVKGKIHWAQVAALALGLLLAFAADVDLYRIAGIPFVWPYVGTVLSGVVMSRGANYVSDFASALWKKVTGNKEYGADEQPNTEA